MLSSGPKRPDLPWMSVHLISNYSISFRPTHGGCCFIVMRTRCDELRGSQSCWASSLKRLKVYLLTIKYSLLVIMCGEFVHKNLIIYNSSVKKTCFFPIRFHREIHTHLSSVFKYFSQWKSISIPKGYVSLLATSSSSSSLPKRQQ